MKTTYIFYSKDCFIIPSALVWQQTMLSLRNVSWCQQWCIKRQVPKMECLYVDSMQYPSAATKQESELSFPPCRRPCQTRLDGAVMPLSDCCCSVYFWSDLYWPYFLTVCSNRYVKHWLWLDKQDHISGSALVPAGRCRVRHARHARELSAHYGECFALLAGGAYMFTCSFRTSIVYPTFSLL